MQVGALAITAGLALLALAAAGPAAALSTDSDQPINIEADEAEADDAQNVTIYRGDVVLTQGTLRVEGDVLTMYFGENQELTKMVAEGDPAHFQQQPDGGGPLQQAEAKVLEYYAKEDTMVLLGDALSWQGEDRIQAERIVYDTRNGKVKAESLQALPEGVTTGGQQGRVKVTINPGNSTESAQ